MAEEIAEVEGEGDQPVADKRKKTWGKKKGKVVQLF